MNDGRKIECEFGDAIVSYLYAELAEDNRERFESHLADCAECIDEFAGVSHARFSVLEWQVGEFAEMPTPRIAVPYEQPVSAGWWAGLRGLFASPGWGSMAAVAAVLVLALGITFLLTDRSAAPPSEIAAIPVVSEDNATPVPLVVSTSDPDIVTPRNVAPPISSRAISSERKRPVVKVNAGVPKQPAVRPVPNVDQAVQKKPVLSSFEEDDDRSLRLADLLDDNGAGS